MTYFNIIYEGKIIYREVSEEECRIIMLELSEHATDNKINPDLIEIEAL